MVHGSKGFHASGVLLASCMQNYSQYGWEFDWSITWGLAYFKFTMIPFEAMRCIVEVGLFILIMVCHDIWHMAPHSITWCIVHSLRERNCYVWCVLVMQELLEELNSFQISLPTLLT